MPIKNALVVDDSMSARIMLRRMLEQKKLAVDLAESAEEALEYLRSKKPDVVFMDHILPGMNGFDATKAISSNPATAMIPVIMYTSKEGTAYLDQARAHGASGILRKPAKPTALAQIIGELERGVAAPPPPESVPVADATPAAPAAVAVEVTPVAAAVPMAEIENIARRIAQNVVAEAVRAAVTESLEGHLGQLRQDLLARGRNAAKDVASDVFVARSVDVSNQLKRYINDQVADVRAMIEASSGLDPALVEEVKHAAMAAVSDAAADAATETAKSVARLAAQNVAEQTAGVIARQVANELYGARSAELTHQFERHVHDQIGELKSSIEQLKSLNPTLAQEVKAVARSAGAHAGTESALQTAERAARQTAQRIGEETGALAGRKAAAAAVHAMRKEIVRLYVVGGGVLALGALAALFSFLAGR
jgi:CheY-like chemotaxis protein